MTNELFIGIATANNPGSCQTPPRIPSVLILFLALWFLFAPSGCGSGTGNGNGDSSSLNSRIKKRRAASEGIPAFRLNKRDLPGYKLTHKMGGNTVLSRSGKQKIKLPPERFEVWNHRKNGDNVAFVYTYFDTDNDAQESFQRCQKRGTYDKNIAATVSRDGKGYNHITFQKDRAVITVISKDSSQAASLTEKIRKKIDNLTDSRSTSALSAVK